MLNCGILTKKVSLNENQEGGAIKPIYFMSVKYQNLLFLMTGKYASELYLIICNIRAARGKHGLIMHFFRQKEFRGKLILIPLQKKFLWL